MQKLMNRVCRYARFVWFHPHYHVVPGRTLSSDIAGEALEVETVEGSTVIDKVIMPSM